MKIRVTFRSGRMFIIERDALDERELTRAVDDLTETIAKRGSFVSRARNSTIVIPIDAIEIVEFF